MNKTFLIFFSLFIFIFCIQSFTLIKTNNTNKTHNRILNYNFKNNSVKIYYINLEKRIDRRNRIIQEFKKSYILNNNYLRYNAINGKELIRNYDIIDFKEKSGWIGCANSHINLWKKSYAEKKVYLIFEDDVFLYDNFDKNIRDVLNNLPNNFDMIYLLTTNYAVKRNYNKLFYKLLDKNFLLNGYIISPNGAYKLLNKIVPYDPTKQIDTWIVENTKNGFLNNYLVKKKIIWTYQDTDSDVQTNIHKKKYHGL